MSEKLNWNKEMYIICCKNYLYFLKGYYDNIGAGRGVLIKDIIEKIEDSLGVKIKKNEEVDEKLKEIQVLVNEYYPIFKEPVDISYKPSDVCISAFCAVVDEIENPTHTIVDTSPKIPAKEMANRLKNKGGRFENVVVPKWGNLKIGDSINHAGLGCGKIVNLVDNGVVQRLDLEFVLKDTQEGFYKNAFIWPLAFEKGLLLETEVLLKRLNKND